MCDDRCLSENHGGPTVEPGGQGTGTKRNEIVRSRDFSHCVY